MLADLSTHMDWAGKRQHRGFRLLSLSGTGPMEAGAEFTSVGSMPMARSRRENDNVVVEARRPEVVEFHTDAVVVWRNGERTEARYEHRYEISPDGEARTLPTGSPRRRSRTPQCGCARR